MARDREKVYIGLPIKMLLVRRDEPLSVILNVAAERYNHFVQRNGYNPQTLMADILIRDVLRERNGKLLSSVEIASLPALVEDFAKRNPAKVSEPTLSTTLSHLRSMEWEGLCGLVDMLERGVKRDEKKAGG